jgi:hypothetical protein
MEHTVRVWGEPQEVSASQKSKTVWIARGNYMGKYIETKGPSEIAAVKHWQEAARYKGN